MENLFIPATFVLIACIVFLVMHIKQIMHIIVVTLIMLFAPSQGASAQEESIFGMEEENPGGWDFDFTVGSVNCSKESGTKFSRHVSSSFSFGWIGGVNTDQDVDIDMGKSYELSWDNVIRTKGRVGKHGLVCVGLSLDWRNYRMTNGLMFNKNQETGKISLTKFPEGSTPKFSRIHTFSLVVPVKYYYQFSKHVVGAIGPELYFTPHASIKNRYTLDDGVKKKDMENNVRINHFAVGVGAQLSVHGIGVYCKYIPCNVLDANYGPKINSMTVGLKLGL